MLFKDQMRDAFLFQTVAHGKPCLASTDNDDGVVVHDSESEDANGVFGLVSAAPAFDLVQLIHG